MEREVQRLIRWTVRLYPNRRNDLWNYRIRMV